MSHKKQIAAMMTDSKGFPIPLNRAARRELLAKARKLWAGRESKEERQERRLRAARWRRGRGRILSLGRRRALLADNS